MSALLCIREVVAWFFSLVHSRGWQKVEEAGMVLDVRAEGRVGFLKPVEKLRHVVLRREKRRWQVAQSEHPFSPSAHLIQHATTDCLPHLLRKLIRLA
jgi:hypothetical protein